MAYITEAELEALLLYSFTATTPITSTQVGTLATTWSAALDGECQVTEGSFGTDTTCPEWVKHAVLQVTAAHVQGILSGSPVPHEQLLKMLRTLIGMKYRYTSLNPSFYQKTPVTDDKDTTQWE